MNDAENLEQIVYKIFKIQKRIPLRNGGNSCIASLNRHPLNLFASNFINRLQRLSRRFGWEAAEEICEKVK
ncbi:MAG: hypothetical protein IIT57_09470, partial [Treponema sp.]|nr:hypothetical protein [Treponema sp.]